MSLTVGLIGIMVLLFLLFLRMPIGFAMALVGFAGFSNIVSVNAALNLIAKDIFATFSSYSLTVVPLFVFMGYIAFQSGMGQRLYYATYRALGHYRGGLTMATIAGCAGFAAICGSTNATAATMGTVTIPEMQRYNYDLALATGAVAAGGTLGILIPPSSVFIIYGIMTEQSIGKLFLAGVLPGILLSVLFILSIYVICRRNPILGPPGPVSSFKEVLLSLTGIGETVLLFCLVMGGLFFGFFTPTEAGGVGAFGAMIIALIRRQLDWKKFLVAVEDTVQTSCMILMIVAGAVIFGRFLSVTRIPFELANWVGGLPLPPIAILGIILMIYAVGGLFMDALAFMMLTISIFFPVVMKLGFDPIWFGVLIIVITEIGAITPPVGINVFVIKGVAKDVPLEVMLIIFPEISLFLPNLIK
jgi:C4-dicarboxylate transporter DctM subunit